jgi:hypothetical protein
MKIPIKLAEEVLYPETVILIKDRDRIIESVNRGKPAVEVVAKNIRLQLPSDSRCASASTGRRLGIFLRRPTKRVREVLVERRAMARRSRENCQFHRQGSPSTDARQ